jgi:hypothetical protein
MISPMHMPIRFFQFGLLALASLALLGGCATYSDSMRDAHAAVAASQPARAAQIINKSLETPDSSQLPAELEEESILLLLERATVLQSLGKFKLAARDMMVVDDHMVFLTVAEADTVDLAKYMYSASSERYVAPAYERLLLNTLNMINYMGLGDIQGAKVEARRFSLMEQFFLDNEEPALLSGILALGNYLGGVAFEHARDYSQAAHYYSRAWYYGVRAPGFRDRLVDLIYLTGYKPRELKAEEGKDAMAKIMQAVAINAATDFDQYRAQYLTGDTLIIVQTGLAPWRVAQRVPIGTAITYTNRSNSRGFSSENSVQLNSMVATGLIESVNFPMLTTMGLPPARPVSVVIDGVDRPIHVNIDVASQVAVGYAHILPNLMVAAITRLITRVAAGEVTEAAVEASGGGGWGLLANLAVQGAMNIADKPDTRSWMTLPGNIRLLRMKLPAASHSITVGVGSQTDARQIDIQENSLNIVNFSRLR